MERVHRPFTLKKDNKFYYVQDEKVDEHYGTNDCWLFINKDTYNEGIVYSNEKTMKNTFCLIKEVIPDVSWYTAEELYFYIPSPIYRVSIPGMGVLCTPFPKYPHESNENFKFFKTKEQAIKFATDINNYNFGLKTTFIHALLFGEEKKVDYCYIYDETYIQRIIKLENLCFV